MTPDKIIKFHVWHEWETPRQGRDVLAINAAGAAETFVRSLDNWSDVSIWHVRVRVAIPGGIDEGWRYEVEIIDVPRFRARQLQLTSQTDRSRQEAVDSFYRTRDARRATC